MLRFAFALAVLLLAVPASSTAAPFGELPFLPAGGTATCLRATGAPGELVRSTTTGAQFLQATAVGLVATGEVAGGGDRSDCPRAAARPGGAGVVAFATQVEGRAKSVVRAAVREPGGAWSAAADLASVEDFTGGRVLATDVSDRGDAVVAFAGRDDRARLLIRAVRRMAGGAFGPAQTLFSLTRTPFSDAHVEAGVSATGETVVAWTLQPVEGEPRALWAAVAPPGGAFGRPVRLGTLFRGTPFAFAMGAGGHALLAFVSEGRLVVAERGPGGPFRLATPVADARDRFITVPAVAVRADGGAFVAWESGLSGDVQAVLRTQPGPFGAPVRIAPLYGLKIPEALLGPALAILGDDLGEITSPGAGADLDGGNLRATITADGRGLVTWAGLGRRDGVLWSAPRAALVPLAGGPAQDLTLGAELREVGSLTPLATADGTAAVAWADNAESERDGRLHLAVEGAADGLDPAPPTVTVGRPLRRVLKATEPLRFPVRCSAACDVRAQVGNGFTAAQGTISMTRAGTRRMVLAPGPVATLRGGPVAVRVRSGAPGARVAAARTVTFDLRRLPDAPVPRILGAVARRDGDVVVVTWRSDRRAGSDDFLVTGTADRDGGEVFGDGEVTRRGREFRCVLPNARGARFVTVLAGDENARRTTRRTVRIRG